MGSGLSGGPLSGNPTASVLSPAATGTALNLSGTLTANALVVTTTASLGAGTILTTAIGQITAVELILTATNGVILGGTRALFDGAGSQLQAQGAVANGATAEGVRLGNSNALSTVGAKAAAFYSDAFTTLVGGIGFRGTLFSGAATIPTTQGTPGSGTLNSPRGKSTMAAAQTTCTITNDQCTAESVVMVTWESDPTGTRYWVVVNAGNFVVTLSAAPAGNVNFRWAIIN